MQLETEVREQVREKNRQLRVLHRRVFQQERKIIELDRLFQQKGIETDITRAEINFLRYPENTDLIPLDQRIDKYMNDVETGLWKDSILCEGAPDF